MSRERTLARWLYERDARIGYVSSRDWEHACALGLDAGYVDDAREVLALFDSGERPEPVATCYECDERLTEALHRDDDGRHRCSACYMLSAGFAGFLIVFWDEWGQPNAESGVYYPGERDAADRRCATLNDRARKGLRYTVEPVGVRAPESEREEPVVVRYYEPGQCPNCLQTPCDGSGTACTPTESREGEERAYPCAHPGCTTMRTKAEGGTTFTVCDEHWNNTPGGTE